MAWEANEITKKKKETFLLQKNDNWRLLKLTVKFCNYPAIYRADHLQWNVNIQDWRSSRRTRCKEGWSTKQHMEATGLVPFEKPR